MNILILSCGTRVKLVEYFKKEFNKEKSKVIVTDCSKYAPALYVADNYHIVPRIDAPGYIDEILEICIKEKIGGIFSLIDPELSLISKNKKKFENIDVKFIGSNYDLNELCFDKYKFYEKLSEFNIPTVNSYNSMETIVKDLEIKKASFPIFMKPITGSASIDTCVVYSINELKDNFKKSNNEFIFQEYMNGKEYGADVYVDLISGEIVSFFIKEKLKMRAGETDKSISIDNINIKNIIKKTLNQFELRGPLDIDIFEKDGEFYISEINPRFGGGYLHAYESGYNFPRLILNNLNNKINEYKEIPFKENSMMKYSDVILIEEATEK